MLRVFYGWTKLNKVRKKESISIIYENRNQNEDKVQRFLSRAQNTVYIRNQTEEEMKDGETSNRMFTEYSIRMDDKKIQGSLIRALDINSEADKNNVSAEERKIIYDRLKAEYLLNNPFYKEPLK